MHHGRDELRENGIEVESFDEFPTTPDADLLKYIREVVLHRVLSDVKCLGDLLGGGSTYDQVDHLLLARAQPITDGR